jgi:hypothetical protein
VSPSLTYFSGVINKLTRFGVHFWTFFGEKHKRTVLPTEALRSIYLLIFPLDVPTLLAMEFGIAACNSLFPFTRVSGLPRCCM